MLNDSHSNWHEYPTIPGSYWFYGFHREPSPTDRPGYDLMEAKLSLDADLVFISERNDKVYRQHQLFGIFCRVDRPEAPEGYLEMVLRKRRIFLEEAPAPQMFKIIKRPPV